MNASLTPVLAFVAVLACIPLALWLLKRTPLGGGAAHGPMRVVAVLPLAPHQRLLTVEVGSGDERRWLVLGATAQGLNLLHTMAPGPDTPAAAPVAPFAAALAGVLKRPAGGPDAR